MEEDCVVIWNMWKYHKKRMRILWRVTRLTKVETLHSNSNWKQQYIYCICTVIVGWSVYMKRMCFTFTVQIMHRIPILMSYFGDHYARLLVSWFLLLHERLEKYILRYGYQGLLVACLVLLYVCLFLVCW